MDVSFGLQHTYYAEFLCALSVSLDEILIFQWLFTEKIADREFRVGSEGFNMLHLAAACNSYVCAKWLVFSKGVELEQKTLAGQNAAHIACVLRAHHVRRLYTPFLRAKRGSWDAFRGIWGSVMDILESGQLPREFTDVLDTLTESVSGSEFAENDETGSQSSDEARYFPVAHDKNQVHAPVPNSPPLDAVDLSQSVWFVSKHDDVNSLVRLIDKSYGRLAKQPELVTNETFGADPMLGLGDEDTLLDPIGNCPLKMHTATRGDIPLLTTV
eukprot:gene26515-33104_t